MVGNLLNNAIEMGLALAAPGPTTLTITSQANCGDESKLISAGPPQRPAGARG